MTYKKPIPTWVILLIIVAVAIMVAAILHLTGIVDLSFISTGYLSVFMWASADIVNAITFTAIFAASVGITCFLIAKRKYITGQKVTVMNPATYNPQVGLTNPTMQPVTQPQENE